MLASMDIAVFVFFALVGLVIYFTYTLPPYA